MPRTNKFVIVMDKLQERLRQLSASLKKTSGEIRECKQLLNERCKVIIDDLKADPKLVDSHEKEIVRLYGVDASLSQLLWTIDKTTTEFNK